MDALQLQDQHVRHAVSTDEPITKEHILRKKILEHHASIPKLSTFPYLIDVEYMCFERNDADIRYKVKPGQGDLLFTNGHNEFVAVEIKSSYVCFNGLDRVQIAKTTKLLDQVYYYQAYQKQRQGPSAKVHGCGITEQKVYWIDHDGTFSEYWWNPGPDIVPPIRPHTTMLNLIDELVDEHMMERFTPAH